MKAKEIRELSDGELRQRLEDAHKELFNLRFRHATRQLANYREMHKVKDTIARIKTILRERELAGQATY